MQFLCILFTQNKQIIEVSLHFIFQPILSHFQLIELENYATCKQTRTNHYELGYTTIM